MDYQCLEMLLLPHTPKADDECTVQQQGDAWACASKICDAMNLTDQTKIQLYNELNSHQESIIKQIEGMNTKFYSKIYKILSAQKYSRDKGVLRASLRSSSDPSQH